jgi:hypothetical protein
MTEIVLMFLNDKGVNEEIIGKIHKFLVWEYSSVVVFLPPMQKPLGSISALLKKRTSNK